MKPYELHHGDCLKLLASMPERSFDCCVTSPPYFGLRDYGTAEWEGGDPGCDHSVGGQVQDNKAPGAIVSGVRPGCDASKCKKCGAVRVDSQIGLEPTPDEFVAKLVAVFREVRRVLRDDGTLWLNLGDSYNAGTNSKRKNGTGGVGNWHTADETGGIRVNVASLKPKDLIGIPWRVAFALQADGWYLRQDIIWHKPNPMPESVTDRCTKAHEYVFLLSKSARYYFDSEAMQEPSVYAGKTGNFNGKK
jgi:site-specific DNA-methyltransferase (cytosine-N4-specific)